MADIIVVSPRAMRAKSDVLKASATTIRGLTEDIKSDISKMRTGWEGEASEKFLVKFNGLNDNFQECFDVINQYAKFLLDAAAGYEGIERETVNQGDTLIS